MTLLKFVLALIKSQEIIKRKDLPLDEVRDKNILYEHARKSNPDFILAVDGDEIFMSNASEILFEELVYNPS